VSRSTALDHSTCIHSWEGPSCMSHESIEQMAIHAKNPLRNKCQLLSDFKEFEVQQQIWILCVRDTVQFLRLFGG
jgi:hypothetical protein